MKVKDEPQSVLSDCGFFGDYMEILFKDKWLVAVNKPYGMPSQPDPTGDEDALTLTARLLGFDSPRDRLWLVHRLDRVVGGVMAFARDRGTSASLSTLISEKVAIKEYFAVVEGEAKGGIIESLLYKDPRASKSFVVDRVREGVKEARLEYIPLECVNTDNSAMTLVRIRLHTGRFHQIRAQMSHIGHPVVGDGKYGSHNNRAKMPALFSASLCFTLRDKEYKLCAMPNFDAYPWCEFSESSYLGEFKK